MKTEPMKYYDKRNIQIFTIHLYFWYRTLSRGVPLEFLVTKFRTQSVKLRSNLQFERK